MSNEQDTTFKVKTLTEALEAAGVDMQCDTYIVLAFNNEGRAVYLACGSLDALDSGADAIKERVRFAKARSQN